MATRSKPEKKKSHANADKERAPCRLTEVQKLDLDCGCFRYRTINVSRGSKLKNLTLIDTQDSIEIRQQKKKVEASAVEGELTVGGDAPVGEPYGSQVDHTLFSDENANACVTM